MIRISRNLKRTILGLTHLMNMFHSLVINVEKLRINSGCYLEKEFTN